MPNTIEVIRDAQSLPIEGRVAVVESLLRTLNPPNTEIDREWIKVASRRLQELRSGQVVGIPGDKVFEKVHERFQK